MLDYTIEQYRVFTELASKRQARELAQQGMAATVGASAGMSGDTKPLEEWTRKLTGEGMGSGSLPAPLRDTLKALVDARKLEIETGNAPRRRTASRPPPTPNRGVREKP